MTTDEFARFLATALQRPTRVVKEAGRKRESDLVISFIRFCYDPADKPKLECFGTRVAYFRMPPA